MGWVKLGLIVVALAALAAVLAPSAVGGDSRLVAQVDQPFVVNGQVFPAGELSVRQVAAYSPTATLNEVCVDRECLGILLAEKLAVRPGGSDNSLIFERDSQGQLVLVGFSYRGEQPRELYGFRAVSSGGRWTTRDSDGSAEPEQLVAAR